MILNMYTIVDTVAGESGDIQLCKNDGIACRFFENALKSSAVKNVGEYKLFKIGVYDNESMEVTSGKPVEVAYTTKEDE